MSSSTLKSERFNLHRSNFKGFGTSCQSQNKYMKQFFQNLRYDIDEVVLQLQENYKHSDTPLMKGVSLDVLLNPDYKELKIFHGKKHLIGCFFETISVEYGLWDFCLILNTQTMKDEFTISVNVGNTYPFNPDSIEDFITEKWGSMIYKQWKQMVLDDINSLVRIIHEVKELISTPLLSISCGDRSSHLMKKVGIPVRRGVGFLFPSSYSV